MVKFLKSALKASNRSQTPHPGFSRSFFSTSSTLKCSPSHTIYKMFPLLAVNFMRKDSGILQQEKSLMIIMSFPRKDAYFMRKWCSEDQWLTPDSAKYARCFIGFVGVMTIVRYIEYYVSEFRIFPKFNVLQKWHKIILPPHFWKCSTSNRAEIFFISTKQILFGGEGLFRKIFLWRFLVDFTKFALVEK